MLPPCSMEFCAETLHYPGKGAPFLIVTISIRCPPACFSPNCKIFLQAGSSSELPTFKDMLKIQF